MRTSLPSSLHPRNASHPKRSAWPTFRRNAVEDGPRVPVRTLAPLQPAASRPLLQHAGAGHKKKKNHSSQQPRAVRAQPQSRGCWERGTRGGASAREAEVGRTPPSRPLAQPSPANSRRPRAPEPAPQRVSYSAPAAAGALPQPRARARVPEPAAALRPCRVPPPDPSVRPPSRPTRAGPLPPDLQTGLGLCPLTCGKVPFFRQTVDITPSDFWDTSSLGLSWGPLPSG